MFAVRTWVLPKLEEYVIKKVRSLSESSQIAKVEIGEISLHPLSLSLELGNIKVEILDPSLAENIDTVSIERARVFLDILDFFTGQVEINTLFVQGLQTFVLVDPWLKDSKGPTVLPVDEIFGLLREVPLRRLILSRWNLGVESRQYQIKSDLQGVGGMFSFLSNRLTARLDVQALTVLSPYTQVQEGSVQIRAQIEPENLNVNNINIKLDKSTLSLQGQFRDWRHLLLKPQGEFKVSSLFHFDQLTELMRPLMKSFPDLKGELEMSGDLQLKSTTDVTGELELKSQAVEIAQFKIGDANLQGKFDAGRLQLSEVVIQHPSGDLSLSHTELQLGNQLPFKTKANLKSLDLQKLFLSLNLKEIPVWLQLRGEVSCAGQSEPFTIACEGEASGKDLRVDSSVKPGSQNIVTLPEFAGRGSVSADLDKVTYNVDLNIKTDTGKSTGTVIYKTGFDIEFQTPKVSIEHLSNLVGLKMQGNLAIQGRTYGDSDRGILEMNLKSPAFTFEDYQLGEIGLNLLYRDSELRFSEILGKLPQSPYRGQVLVDLATDTIQGNIDSPQLEFQDVFYAIEPQLKLPFSITGLGFAKAQFSGPLDFWKMNYTVQSQFRKGKIHTDSYESLQAIIKGVDGNLNIERGILQKNKSQIVVSGGITSNKQYAMAFATEGLNIEESEFINQFNSRLQGALEAKAKLIGPILDPDLRVSGNLSEIFLGEDTLPDSVFDLRIGRYQMGGTAELFGKAFRGTFQFPFGPRRSPIALNFSANSWDFARLFPLLGSSPVQTEYDSYFTGDLNLNSPDGDWEKLTGQIEMRNVFLRRGDLFLRNLKPAFANFRDGQISLRDWDLRGVGTELRAEGPDFNLKNLDLKVNGRGDVRFFQVLIPALDDLSGAATLDAKITGHWLKPNVLGSANLREGYIKITGFPHPIERVSGDASFSETRVHLTNLKATLAGGSVSGAGSISFEGLRDIPIDIQLTVDGAKLNVPDRVESQGRMDLAFTGRWFPYVLKGTYTVSTGIVSKEFTDTNTAIMGIRKSSLLPKFAKEASASQLNLDIDLILPRSILIKNSLIDGAVAGRLRVKGPVNQPGLVGQIELAKGSKLTFRDKEFEVITGQMTFSSPEDINPEVYINSQARIGDYDVTLLIQGPAKNLAFKLSSIPPLADGEIFSLLALGITGSKLDESVSSREQEQQTYSELGAFILNKAPINRPLKDTLGIEMQITSSFDTAKNVSVPKATFSRRLNKRMNAIFSRALSDKGNNEFKLQYVINPNLSAVGSWEGAEAQEGSNIETTNPQSDIWGLDLEFKKDFK